MTSLDGTGTISDLPKILCIAGWGRSGSTLIARALGGIEGWCTIGEARRVWDLGILRNEPCTCGAAFRECPFWKPVFERAFGGMDEDLARRMIAALGSVHSWQMGLLPTAMLRRRAAAQAEMIDVVHRLYRAIGEVSGARVIVDSSKLPAYAFVLDQVTENRLVIGHLVRDPRACTYSWSKRRKRQTFGTMSAVGPVGNGLQWVNRNRAIRAVWGHEKDRYRVLRYEDFVADPRSFMVDLSKAVGEDSIDLSHLHDNGIDLAPTHMAAGNPNRFETGLIAIRLDSEWVSALSRREQAVVRLLAGSEMRRHGYS